MKKYELTTEVKVELGVTLHRIRALVDIVRHGVKAGDLGGWVEKESNLDQEHDAWVYDDARVYGDAQVCKTAHVLTVGPIGSRDDTTTFFRAKFSAGFAISVCCGCFRGTVDEFRAKVKQTHGDSKYGKAYQLAADLAETQIEIDKEAL